MSDDLINNLRLPRRPGTVFEQADWDLCLGIEDCAKKTGETKANADSVKNFTMPAEPVEPVEPVVDPRKAKNSPRGTRRRLFTPESDEGSFTMSPPKKKTRVEGGLDARQVHIRTELVSTMPPPVMNLSPRLSSPRAVVEPVQSVYRTPENSSPESTILSDSHKEVTSTGSRRETDRLDFHIYEDTYEDELSNHLIASRTWFPIFADDDKENNPVEYDVGENDDTEEVLVETFEESQTRRSILGEIQNPAIPREDQNLQIVLPAGEIEYEYDYEYEYVDEEDTEIVIPFPERMGETPVDILSEEYYAEDYFDEYEDDGSYATDVEL